MKNITFKIVFLSITVLFFSCSTEKITNSELESFKPEYKFNYSLYNNNQKKIKNFLYENKDLIESKATEDNIEIAQDIIYQINVEEGTSLELLQLDYDLLGDQYTDNSYFVSNGYISKTESNMISVFGNDIELYGFDRAIENLQANIIALQPNQEEFDKYNFLVNTMLLANLSLEVFYESEPNFDSPECLDCEFARSWWKAAGCGVAIASNAIATYSLVACAVPNPTTPAACGVAVTAKVLSLAGVAFGCF